MPSGRSTEELAIAHGKELCRAVRRAQRIGPNTGMGRLIDQRHELLPLVRFARCLAQVVIYNSTTRGLREAAHEAVFQLRVASTTTLDNASPQLSQDIAQSKDFFFLSPQRRDQRSLGVVVPTIARHRQPQC